MKIHLNSLEIRFKKSVEIIEFRDFSYFFGQMGAGKSTIARLIDYCFGGKLGESEMTPALQSEFQSVSLNLHVNETPLALHRNVRSDNVSAHWVMANEGFDAVIPARNSSGEAVQGTGIEVLSDLIYYLCGMTPPKVRRSKHNEDSELERLSIRDLLWYCYLDQDSIDSNFFHLDHDANTFKRLKSRDVLRFIVGFHQEYVAELEVKLELARLERNRCEAGAQAIRDALTSAELASETELLEHRVNLEAEAKSLDKEIAEIRQGIAHIRSHSAGTLQERARKLGREIDRLRLAQDDLRESVARYKAHRNELLSLSTKFRRAQSAREVLGGVDFKDCPRCSNLLPPRPSDVCAVCGQSHALIPTGAIDEASAERDLELRLAELQELTQQSEEQHRKVDRLIRERISEKSTVEYDLQIESENYDSIYLSAALSVEKRRASVRQEMLDLEKFEVLIKRIKDLETKCNQLAVHEQRIRADLKEARNKAESDTHNLVRLKHLFLDCLIRAKVPGFISSDIVEMKSPDFLPEVTSAGLGDLLVTSFGNLGSGGKKTLFKCCFAVAVHRLAVEIGAVLPTLLIIDSPMKNISERENREQFEGFHKMLYQLSRNELTGTQFILIDKELCAPPAEYGDAFIARHMKPDDLVDAPLIRYYRGK